MELGLYSFLQEGCSKRSRILCVCFFLPNNSLKIYRSPKLKLVWSQLTAELSSSTSGDTEVLGDHHNWVKSHQVKHHPWVLVPGLWKKCNTDSWEAWGLNETIFYSASTKPGEEHVLDESFLILCFRVMIGDQLWSETLLWSFFHFHMVHMGFTSLLDIIYQERMSLIRSTFGANSEKTIWKSVSSMASDVSQAILSTIN